MSGDRTPAVRAKKGSEPSGASSKARRRAARPFPLLEDGQDPNGLPARVAYHLHRLKLTGKRLRDCGFAPGYQVRELTQGRLPLAVRDVEALAACLNVPIIELSRQLTSQETKTWGFYRASARQGGQVWARARVAWERENFSVSKAANIMGLDRTIVARNIQPQRRRGYKVFPYGAACRLALALGHPEGAWFVLGQGGDAGTDEPKA